MLSTNRYYMSNTNVPSHFHQNAISTYQSCIARDDSNVCYPHFHESKNKHYQRHSYGRTTKRHECIIPLHVREGVKEQENITTVDTQIVREFRDFSIFSRRLALVRFRSRTRSIVASLFHFFSIPFFASISLRLCLSFPCVSV